jgi:YggT family protein
VAPSAAALRHGGNWLRRLFSAAAQAAIRLARRHGSSAETSMENPILWLIDTIITLYIWILIAAAILSWLIAFNVVNTRNPFVASVANFFYHVTEPALRPIRAIMPNLGGIDISPVILIIALLFIERIIFWLYYSVFA